jgi:hypothetical protein
MNSEAAAAAAATAQQQELNIVSAIKTAGTFTAFGLMASAELIIKGTGKLCHQFDKTKTSAEHSSEVRKRTYEKVQKRFEDALNY